MRKNNLFYTIFIMVVIAAMPCDANRIRPYIQNSYYWQYKGQPLLLIGGSKEDNLFQESDLQSQLNEISNFGGNYIRNTMSDRPDAGYEVRAFKKLDTGLYDLNQWNSEYWTRFHNLLQWTNELDIIVQIELWDRFDFWDSMGWGSHPFNPSMNINYTTSESGLAVSYTAHPGTDVQPFFHTVPDMDNNTVVLNFQQKFVDKMLSYSLGYGNVLYTMNNETSTDTKWGKYWMAYIKAKADSANVDVYTTDMFDDGLDLDVNPEFLEMFDSPDIYTFVDISQNNSLKNSAEKHWANILFVRDRISGSPRPINNTKIYGSDEWVLSAYTKRTNLRWGDLAGTNSFWMNLIGGCASSRFHRGWAGLNIRPEAQANIQAARKLESLINLWEIEPRNDLLTNRGTFIVETPVDHTVIYGEAYLAANPGEKYALYFTKGGSVGLKLDNYSETTFSLKWINITDGSWGNETTVSGGNTVTISAPSNDGWVAAIVSTSSFHSLIPQTGWTLKFVDSQEMDIDVPKPATNAFDGDRNTIWSTQWFEADPPHPHEIQINLGTSHNIGGFLYLPRQDGNYNGIIKEYQFYISNDGVSWGDPVAIGEFVDDKEARVLFTPKTGQYIRLVALSELNGNPWTTMAEINVLSFVSGDVSGDLNKDGLTNILDVQACVNHVLGKEDFGEAADVNKDGSVDILDLQCIVNIVLDEVEP